MNFFDYKIKAVSFTDEFISIETVDGKKASLPLNRFPRLMNATEEERLKFEIVSNGHALCWEDLDEDLSAVGFFK